MAGAKQAIALSFDVDWAPDEVLQDSIDLLRAAGARATFFATHVTPVLAALDPAQFEIGIHPNFNPLLDGRPHDTGAKTFRDVLAAAVAMYPNVVGMRSHGVVSSGPLMYHAPEYGITYESNMYVPWPVPPFRDYDNLVRVPMYWSDYRELLVGTPYRPDALILPAECPAIMAFHPAHVFLNSETPERSKRLRGATVASQRAARHIGPPHGIRDFLEGVIARAHREDRPMLLMREVAERHVVQGGRIAIHGETLAEGGPR
jgi:hypothetical protein